MSDRHKVLLIEDDADYARLAGTALARSRPDYLNGRRFEVVRADSLSTGLERLAAGGIDIVLLDLTLPDSRGLDTFVKVHKSAPELPVVVLTGIEDDAVVARAVEEGAEDYLVKSHTHRSVLVRAVWHALGRHRLRSRRKQAGETRFRGIIANTADGILIVSRGGTVRFANPAAETMFGRKRNELVGEMFGFPVAAGETAELDIVRRRGERCVVEMRVTETVWRDESVYLASLRDVTERIRAQEALRDSEENWRSLVENAPNIIMVVDSDGTLKFINHTVSDINPEEPIGRTLYSYIEPQFHDVVRQTIRQVFQTGRPGSYEIRGTGSRGGVSWYETQVGPIRRDEQVVAAILITADTTERKRAEEKLRDSEERWRSLASTAPAVILTLGRKGTIQSLNRSVGPYTTEEAIGTCAYDYVSPDQREMMKNCIGRVFQTGEPGRYEVLGAGAEGPNTAWYETCVGPIVRDGQVAAVTLVSTDITARKRAGKALRETEEQLRQSQKMEAVGRLAGGIAHDFNNLLTVITGYSELVLQRLDEKDPLSRDLEGIRKAGERAASLTGQLLAFSRRQILQPRLLDLNAVVRDMEKMLARLIGEDVELVTVREPGPTRIKADRSQIEQVIMNLAVNARDAMPDGGKLTVETASVHLGEECARQHVVLTPGRYVMLAVTDTGDGMDEETRRRIFEPFFTTKKAGKGTGLGLSTVYGIVKQSGGDIRVYSEPGQGTTFKIYLPRGAGEVEPEEAATEPAKPLTGTETVLLAEDEEVVRELAKRILTHYGYRVLAAANGGEALLICENRKEMIHLLLTDLVMPEMSGRELCDRLAPLRPGMKSLYMSGYPDTAVFHQRALEPGMPFIQKPFSPESLARKVREVLGAPAGAEVIPVAGSSTSRSRGQR